MMDALPRPPRAAPMALQQSPDWTRALRRMGVRAAELQIGGQPVQVIRRALPVLGDTAMISRAGLQRLDALRPTLGVRSLIVNAEDEAEARALRETGFVRIAAPRRHAIVDLLDDAASQRSALRANWRNQLRRAQAADITLRSGPMPPRPGHWLILNDALAQRSKGYRTLPPALLAAFAAVRPEATRLFTAHDDDRPIAGILVLRHGASASYQLGWSGLEGRAVHAHNLLLWKAMRWLAGLGVETLDLGSCDPRADTGLAHFKLGTGARLRELGGTWVETAWLAPLHRLRRSTAPASTSPRARRRGTQTQT